MLIGKRLRQERLQRHLSQEALAEALGVSPKSIRRWEKDQVTPQVHYQLQLSRFFGLRPDELFEEQEDQATLTPLWSVPYQRNPFFTGRDTFLQTLHHRLCSQGSIVLSQSYALSGLGGIGKTQLALEYVYQHSLAYSAVFWVVTETIETLYAGFTAIAAQLQLPEREEKEAEKVVHAVLGWLNTHDKWLLVFDNVVSVALLKPFLPTTRHGAILLTTQLHTMEGLFYTLELPPFSSDEGVEFLLHRAKLINPISSTDLLPSEIAEPAQALVKAVGGLPLALDQAGAYIERTGCRMGDYLHLFHHHPTSLLAERSEIAHHPTSVVKTFQLSFEQMIREHEAAADLLRVCAFLAPDAIPEELLTKGASFLGSRLETVIPQSHQFNQMLGEALRYSLLDRQPQNYTFSMHRLVQAVLYDTLSETERRIWAERVVLAVNAAFPDIEHGTRLHCERLLPHVLVCATWIEQEAMPTVESAHLLRKAGIYLQERVQYSEAEPLLVQAFTICEKQLGTEHPETVRSLNNLTVLYRLQGKYEQAESLSLRALAICEKQFEAEHPETARSLNNLAVLYTQQRKYEQAEFLSLRALAIREKQLGAEHPETAKSLDNLANLYGFQGKYEQAEFLSLRALTIREQQLGVEHPYTARSLNNLAFLYREQGKYEQAEPLYERALTLKEQQLGTEHPETASSLQGLAELYQYQGKYEQAESMYKRVLAICKQHLGTEHSYTAYPLYGLAELYRYQGKYEQAEPLSLRALAIREQQLGTEHPDTAEALYGLAELYRYQGKYEQAVSLYQRAIRIQELVGGPNYLDVTFPLNGLANLYRAQGKYEQADLLYQRTLHLQEEKLGQHPNLAQTLYDLATLREMQGRIPEAMSLYQRTLAIQERTLGCKHPKTSETCERLAGFLEARQ